LTETQSLESRRVLVVVVILVIGVALATALFPGLGVLVAAVGLLVPLVRRHRSAKVSMVVVGSASLLVSAMILLAVYGPMDVGYTFH
jgi:hypothetical protein